MTSYRVYFRFRRGDIGIPYELAKTEFSAVFAPYGLRIEREWAVRSRMWVTLALQPNQVASLASNLGYTEAILYAQVEPYRGETLNPTERGRWYTGWIREKASKIHLTEIYVQDAQVLSAQGPHRRQFLFNNDGQKRVIIGRRERRGISLLDVRFLFNVAKTTPDSLILDPVCWIWRYYRRSTATPTRHLCK